MSPFTNDMAAELTLIETRDVGHCQLVTLLLTHCDVTWIVLSDLNDGLRRISKIQLDYEKEMDSCVSLTLNEPEECCTLGKLHSLFATHNNSDIAQTEAAQTSDSLP